MVERKAFLQITKAIILGLRNGLTDPSVNLKQSIMEELARILGVERCVLFKVTREGTDGNRQEFCEIIAGVPPEEYASEPPRKEALEAHPDVAAAVKNEGTC